MASGLELRPARIGTFGSGSDDLAETRSRLWALVTIIAFGFSLRLWFVAGISGNDDLSLARNAIAILNHGLHLPTEHYAARLGLTLPLAALFRIFGIGVAQLITMPMVASLLGMFLAYRIGCALFDARVGLVAAAVLGLYPMDVEYAGLFFPDLIQGVAMAAAFALALHASYERRSDLRAIAAGLCWSYAYYVKIDAFFMGPVFLVATALGYVRVRSLVILCTVTAILVGAELVTYGVLTGSPLYHIELERRAANEILAPGMDYRNLFTYPKAMFITPYETGVHFYLLLIAVIAATAARSRPALMMVAWILVFLIWLMIGGDPFGHAFRLKPQLGRYLMDFSVPMAVLIGWFLVWAYAHVWHWAVIAVCVVGAAVALIFMQFNLLNYEAPLATRVAAEAALRHDWFPLYADLQSAGVADFVLYNTPGQDQVLPAERHDFLSGVTTFASISVPDAYLLVNNDYIQRLKSRNLVQPLSPTRFGMKHTRVLSVDNPVSPLSYYVLKGLTKLSAFLPLASIRAHIEKVAEDVLQPNDAEIYRLQCDNAQQAECDQTR